MGCSSLDYFTLSGESKYWEGKYSTTKDGNAETVNYSFHYKNGKNSDTHFKFVEVSINEGKPSSKEEFKGATINK